jgi:hypothetical protein
MGVLLAGLIAWSPPVMAQQKTVKQCREEWKAGKEAFAAAGKTQRLVVAECRGVALAGLKAPMQGSTGKGQFQTEAQARSDCQSDPVVWVNLRSGVYHESASKNYGTTRTGAYMCEKESIAQGFRASKATREPGKEPSSNPANATAS